MDISNLSKIIKEYAGRRDFITDSEIISLAKELYPSIKMESKLDYFVRTGIKEKELALIANKTQIDEFLNNCLISLK